MPQPIAFNIQQNSQNANTSTKVLLYDASGNPISSTAGALDVNIVNGGTSSPLQAQAIDGSLHYLYRANAIATGTLTQSGSVNIFAPGVGIYYVITALNLAIDLTSVGTGATNVVTVSDSVDGTIFTWNPKFATTVTTPTIPAALNLQTPAGFCYHSSTPNSTLSFSLNGSLGAFSVALILTISYTLTTSAN